MSSSHVSASFSNVTFMSRISYRSFHPNLIWYKCDSGDLGTNTIYNHATNSTDVTVGNLSLDNTVYKTGTASLNLSGTQYIRPPTIDFSKYSGNTYCLWFKLPSLDHGACFASFSGNSDWTMSDFLLMWGSSNYNSVKEYTYTDGYKDITPIQNLMDNTWHHFAWIFGITPVHKLYVDGVFSGSISTTPFNVNANGTGSYIFHVPWNDGTTTPQGHIDDICLYDVVLNDAQISALYHA